MADDDLWREIRGIKPPDGADALFANNPGLAASLHQNEKLPQSASSKAKADLWTASDKAVVAVFEMLGLLFGLPFGDDLYQGRTVAGWHWFYLVIGIICAASGPMWPWVRTQSWFSEKVVARVTRAASNPVVWGGLLLLNFLYITGPELYGRFIGDQLTADTQKHEAALKAQLDAANREIVSKDRQIQNLTHPPLSPSPPPLAARAPGDADKEIPVIDKLFKVLQEANSQPQDGDVIIHAWVDAMGDDAKRQAYLQSLISFRDKVAVTDKKINDLLNDFQFYCNNDLCAIANQRRGDDVSNAVLRFYDTLFSLSKIIDFQKLYSSINPTLRNIIENNPLAPILAPSIARAHESLEAYHAWLSQTENKLLERRDALSKIASRQP